MTPWDVALVESHQTPCQEGQVGSRLLIVLCALHQEAVDHLGNGDSWQQPGPAALALTQCQGMLCGGRNSTPRGGLGCYLLHLIMWSWTSSLGFDAGALGLVSCTTHMKSPSAACVACGCRVATRLLGLCVAILVLLRSLRCHLVTWVTHPTYQLNTQPCEFKIQNNIYINIKKKKKKTL